MWVGTRARTVLETALLGIIPLNESKPVSAEKLPGSELGIRTVADIIWQLYLARGVAFGLAGKLKSRDRGSFPLS